MGYKCRVGLNRPGAGAIYGDCIVLRRQCLRQFAVGDFEIAIKRICITMIVHFICIANNHFLNSD